MAAKFRTIALALMVALFTNALPAHALPPGQPSPEQMQRLVKELNDEVLRQTELSNSIPAMRKSEVLKREEILGKKFAEQLVMLNSLSSSPIDEKERMQKMESLVSEMRGTVSLAFAVANKSLIKDAKMTSLATMLPLTAGLAYLSYWLYGQSTHYLGNAQINYFFYSVISGIAAITAAISTHNTVNKTIDLPAYVTLPIKNIETILAKNKAIKAFLKPIQDISKKELGSFAPPVLGKEKWLAQVLEIAHRRLECQRLLTEPTMAPIDEMVANPQASISIAPIKNKIQ